MQDPAPAEPDDEWEFPPELDLIASAGQLAYLATPLHEASLALAALIAVARESELATKAQEAAAVCAVLSFRAARAVAVLTAAGLTSEAHGHVRRLGEFAAVAEYLRTTDGPAYATRWVEGRASPSKLLKGEAERKFKEYLSQGAHADARHFWDLPTDGDGVYDPFPGRDTVRDMVVPWAATCLSRDVVRASELSLGLDDKRSVRLAGVIDHYAAAAQLALQNS